MNTPDNDDAKLLDVLNRHPGIKRRVETLADVIVDGEVEPAGEAERRVIEEARRPGGELLHGRAEGRIEDMGEQVAQAPETRWAGKKTLLAHTSGTVANDLYHARDYLSTAATSSTISK